MDFQEWISNEIILSPQSHGRQFACWNCLSLLPAARIQLLVPQNRRGSCGSLLPRRCSALDNQWTRVSCHDSIHYNIQTCAGWFYLFREKKILWENFIYFLLLKNFTIIFLIRFGSKVHLTINHPYHPHTKCPL